MRAPLVKDAEDLDEVDVCVAEVVVLKNIGPGTHDKVEDG